MAGKYYAVRRGKSTGIYQSWDECKKQVTGFSNAEYKSFKTYQEAKDFMDGTAGTMRITSSKRGEEASISDLVVDNDTIVAYVDGSYHKGTNEFSYGMVILKDGKELKFSKKVDDPSLASMHNVAGEIKGAEAAMQYALDMQYKKVIIYHDYAGIAKWCLGEWKANKEGTQAYKAFYDRAIEKVKIEFVKVTGHSNDKYNDMADVLAKQALGIPTN